MNVILLVVLVWLLSAAGTILFNIWVARRNHQRVNFGPLASRSLLLGPFLLCFFVGMFILSKFLDAEIKAVERDRQQAEEDYTRVVNPGARQQPKPKSGDFGRNCL